MNEKKSSKAEKTSKPKEPSQFIKKIIKPGTALNKKIEAATKQDPENTD